MDNREFDNIFAKGLQETQSFDSAEAGWEKLSPRLHPPKKRKRFLLWPFFMIGALLLLGISTFWYYHQSSTLKQEIQVLNEQLQEQVTSQARQNNSASTENQGTTNSSIDTENNSTTNQATKINNHQKNNTVDSSPKSSHENPKTIFPVISDKPNESLFEAVKNAPADIIPVRKNPLPVAIEADEPIAIAVGPVDLDQTEQMDFLYANLSPLDFERALPELKYDLEEAVAEEEAPLKLSRWTIGISANIAQSIGLSRSDDNSLSELFLPTNLADRIISNSRNYHQFGIHSNFALNTNWQLRGTLSYERLREFIFDVIVPSDFNSYAFNPSGQVINSNTLADYKSTESIQKSWLVEMGINRKIFRVKSVRVSLGAQVMTRFTKVELNFFKEYSVKSASLGAERKLPISLAIAPSLNIAGPIAKRFYWQIESKYAFNINPKLTLPNFIMGLGFGFKI